MSCIYCLPLLYFALEIYFLLNILSSNNFLIKNKQEA